MTSDWNADEASAGIDELLAGKPYQVVSRLGAGGMGEVHVVRAEFGRLFALKTLHPFLAARQEFISRMRFEAKTMGLLQHPNVVDVYDFWISHGRPCIVMQLLRGRTLAEELRLRRRLPPEEAVGLTCQALDALTAAHALGIVHRDVKPANLYLHEQAPGLGRILKVLDFGFVRLIEGSNGLAPPSMHTQTGAIVGTPRFMSPEQARSEPVDHRTDIYSLGITLYVTLTGRGPFDLGEKKASPPSRHVPAVSPSLDAIVLRAIQPSKDDRYQSATAFLHDLRAASLAAEQNSRR